MPKRSTAAIATAFALAFAAGAAHAADTSASLPNADHAAAVPMPSAHTLSAMDKVKGWFGKTSGWQCAQFARMFSGIQLFGDAGTWWSQALGKYARGFSPEAGSVLVFKPYGPMTRGHVAVVSQVLTDRIIQVTHANWSVIGGHRGQVEKDVTVVDVSKAGDWSQVKVFYNPTGDLGTTVYPTFGFVYKAAKAAFGAATGAGRETGASAVAALDADR
jgi:surface antigen